MKAILRSVAVVAIGSALAGCHGSEPAPTAPSSPAPATKPVAIVPTSPNTAAPTPAVIEKPVMLPDKDMTHTLSADSPYFTSSPKADAKPTGTFKSGTKVLVLVPGATYSKVTAQNGVTAFTVTDNLQPLGK